MMRFTAALALCVLLAGCLPILPPAMSVASLGVSGFSVLTTGKSASDHVLSATNEQDCALYRLAFGQSMCREYREGETRITVSYDYDYPGGDADGGFDLSDTQLAAAPAPEERKTASTQDDGQRVAPTIRPTGGDALLTEHAAQPVGKRGAIAQAADFRNMDVPNTDVPNTPLVRPVDTDAVLIAHAELREPPIRTDNARVGNADILVAAAADVEPATTSGQAVRSGSSASGAVPVLPVMRSAQGPAGVLPRLSPYRTFQAEPDLSADRVPLPALASSQSSVMHHRLVGPPSLAVNRVAIPQLFGTLGAS